MDNSTKKEIRSVITLIGNIRIRFKLYILIGVALLGMLIIGGMSFYLMGQMNEMTSDSECYHFFFKCPVLLP